MAATAAHPMAALIWLGFHSALMETRAMRATSRVALMPTIATYSRVRFTTAPVRDPRSAGLKLFQSSVGIPRFRRTRHRSHHDRDRHRERAAPPLEGRRQVSPQAARAAISSDASSVSPGTIMP